MKSFRFDILIVLFCFNSAFIGLSGCYKKTMDKHDIQTEEQEFEKKVTLELPDRDVFYYCGELIENSPQQIKNMDSQFAKKLSPEIKLRIETWAVYNRHIFEESNFLSLIRRCKSFAKGNDSSFFIQKEELIGQP